MKNIDETIEIILRNALAREKSIGNADGEANRHAYIQSFEGEGERKIRFVVDDLEALKEAGLLNPHRTVAMSVGGADGSDVLALMKRMNLPAGVLLEYDNDAGLNAQEKTRELREEGSRKFSVVIGDAIQKLDTALDKAKSAVEGADTLVVLCFGVLHELPKRSPNYTHDRFFDILFSAFPTVVVYCAEPCAQPEFPLGWPVSVELGFPGVKADRLAGIARFICDRLFEGKAGAPEQRGHGLVRMSRDLAVELLHKTLRFSSVDRFHHEMGERLTSFDVQSLSSMLATRIGNLEQEIAYRTSDGFRKEYRDYGVNVRDERGAALPIPFTHTRLILRRFSQPQPELQRAKAEAPVPAPNPAPAKAPAAADRASAAGAPSTPGGSGANISVSNHAGNNVNSTVKNRIYNFHK